VYNAAAHTGAGRQRGLALRRGAGRQVLALKAGTAVQRSSCSAAGRSPSPCLFAAPLEALTEAHSAEAAAVVNSAEPVSLPAYRTSFAAMVNSAEARPQRWQYARREADGEASGPLGHLEQRMGSSSEGRAANVVGRPEQRGQKRRRQPDTELACLTTAAVADTSAAAPGEAHGVCPGVTRARFLGTWTVATWAIAWPTCRVASRLPNWPSPLCPVASRLLRAAATAASAPNTPGGGTPAAGRARPRCPRWAAPTAHGAYST
jgi:hypothetical protein